jgi:hypothetical protein
MVVVVFALNLSASTMFLLTKIPKAYLVVENYSSQVPMEIKKEILEEMKYFTDELKIDTTGYSHRTLAFVLYETILNGKPVLNIDLVLGEEVKRLDDEEEVYALTYEKRHQMSYGERSEYEIKEKVLEYVDLLLNDFSEQYKEDNR